jgi:concentrative nucleoside transporter, CNT family
LEKIISFVGLLVFIGIAFLLSTNKKSINIRTVLTGLALQFGIGLLILKSPLASHFFYLTNVASAKIIAFGSEGASFVFGPLANSDVFIFAVGVSTTVIFVGALTALLYHIGVMQFVISLAGKIMQKIMGTSGPESIACAANVFSGMTEAPLVVRPYLHKMTHSELMAVLTGGLATIAGSVFIVYVKFGIDPAHLLSASFMSAPAARVIAKIMVPELKKPPKDEDVKLTNDYKGANFMDAICKGAADGLKLSLNIMAMLIAVIAIIALVNYAFTFAGNLAGIQELTLQKIMGYIFAPFAWIMGVPAKDILAVGQLLGEKLIINEFVAYVNLSKIQATLDPRSSTIAIYALCGFANFSSIAIQIGGISILAPERRSELAKLSLYSLIGGTIACLMTATVAGILI